MGLFNIFNKKTTTAQSKTYTCARCKKEITDSESKWIGNHRFCSNCAARMKANTAAIQHASPKSSNKDIGKECVTACDSTKLYLKLSEDYPKEKIDMKNFHFLEFIKLDKELLSANVKLLTISEDIVYFLLDRDTGTPYVAEQWDAVLNLYIAFKVSYDEIKKLMSEHQRFKYRDINESNWCKYTILQEGERMVIYYNKNGDGPYHNETRFGICVKNDGYSIIYQEISPMGGGCSKADTLPFGFFKGKTLSEITDFFRNYANYIDPSKIELSNGDYSLLIRTDEYYSK